MTRHQRDIRRVFKRCGCTKATVVRQGKHIIWQVEHKGRQRKIVTSATPSDYKSLRNIERHYRKEFG